MNVSMSCSVCGKGVRTGAKFCPSCGNALVVSLPVSGPGRTTSHHTSICPNCLQTIHSGMRFCRTCGQTLQGIFCPLCSRANRPNVKYCAHCGSLLGTRPPSNPYETGKLPPGMILGGRYLLIRKIAQGGMGAVYEAKEVPISTCPRLAIKEMSLSILSRLNPEQQLVLVESFHREFELLSKLSHPNLVQAYQFFEEQSRYFFVMEFIEGRTLETVIDTLPPGQLLPVDRVLAWARQLCNVLYFLHTRTPPIIYRDLKPSNVMELYPTLNSQTAEAILAVERSDLASAEDVRIKLFDFGIARFYKPGQKSDTVRFGTDGYLAPEIVAYQVQTSEHTDVYSLGALLHQVLTRFDPQMDPWKRPPIRSINPYVPEQVVNAIEHALAMNPADRTPGIADLLVELFGPDARPSLDQPVFPIQVDQSKPYPDVATPAAVPGVAMLSMPSLPSKPVEVEQQMAVPALVEQAVLPASGSEVTTVLNLGEIKKGKTATGSFEVIISGDIPALSQSQAVVQGQIISHSPWLKADIEYFPTNTNRSVHVHARTSSLPLGRWNIPSRAGQQVATSSSIPLWFLKLPRFLRSWLAFHLNIFVPLPSRHQGLMQVKIPGNPDMLIQTIVEVIPPAWRGFVGWVLVFGMIGLEVCLILALILLAVNLLVPLVI